MMRFVDGKNGRGMLLALILSACSFSPDAGLTRPDAQETSGLDQDAPSTQGDTPRCQTQGDKLSCAYQIVDFDLPGDTRRVLYQVPASMPPLGGYPVAVLFHGALATAESMWSSNFYDAGGAFYETTLIERLLAAGYAVVTPEANGDTGLWNTNVLPWSSNWTASPDHALMQELFRVMQTGAFGALSERWFAAGFSSGGYMTSRMALSYAGTFRALAIHSASWATCVGAACIVPASMPADHPPTLFLHGGADPIVPPATIRAYENRLRDSGCSTQRTVSAGLGHEWLSVAPDEILAWFDGV